MEMLGENTLMNKIAEGGDEENQKCYTKYSKNKTGGGNSQILLRCDPVEFDIDEDIPNILLWIGNNEHSEVRLKGSGGYVIVPRSVHSTGSRYEFEDRA